VERVVSPGHAMTGYMVRLMRLIPTNKLWPAKESDCDGSPVMRAVTTSDDKAVEVEDTSRDKLWRAMLSLPATRRLVTW